MRNSERGIRNAALAALALVLGAGALRAQPSYSASASADRGKIKLWESVQVTITVEGPAPVRGALSLADQLLDDAANKNWRVRPKSASVMSAVPGHIGRERWQQVFRLDPIDIDPTLLGKPIRVAFAPVRINGTPLDQPLAIEVIVERTGKPDDPLPESLPVTTVEDPPPPLDLRTEGSNGAAWAAVAVALACAVGGVCVWRRRRRPKPVPAGTWARTALAKLEAEQYGGPDVAERVADVLRRFTERRFGLPATKLTTSELYEATTVQGWPAGDAQSLRRLLDECDLAKFAGAEPDFEGCARLIGAAREWLDRVDPPAPAA